MEHLQDLFNDLMNSQQLIHTGGLILIVIVIFLETGLFFGFFLPGDYLLFTAGLLCGTRDLNVSIFTLLISVTLAAIAGSFVGYWSGRIAGKRLFTREDSFFFRKSHLEKAREFFKKHGPKSLIAGRFLSIVRTFAPIIAGALEIDFKKFSIYNIVGAVLWVGSLIPIGYFFGTKYPQTIDYLHYIIIGFIIVTGALVLHAYLKSREEQKQSNSQ